jgi:GNAT superfamily N-acetyltransferase
MTLTVEPLTPARMPDLDALFLARGCSVAKRCYCMYYRVTGGGWTPALDTRAALAQLAQGDPPPGLIGYRDGTPVGWVSFGPRQDFARLANSRTMRAVDDANVWSIVCFVVPSAYRRQGVAHDLLEAAVRYAREHGATIVEAYPVDRSVAGAPNAPWFGSLSMFAKAGFVEVARRTAARPIVRKDCGR